MAQASWRDAVDTAYCIRSNDTPFLSTVTTRRNGAGRAKPHYGILKGADGDTVAHDAALHAIRHLSAREAVFEQGHIVKEALKATIGKTDRQAVEAAVKSLDGAVKVRSTTFQTGGNHIFHGRTINRSLGWEAKVSEAIVRHREQVWPLASTASINSVLTSRSLTNEQQKAARFVLRSRDRIVSVLGVAGSGKSHLVRAVVAATPSRQHMALAPTASAAVGLGKSAGIDAATLAGFLATGGRKAGRNTVLFVDEASMTSTRQALRLMALAEKHKFRIVFIGDTKQYDAIDQGKPLAILMQQGLRGPFIGKSFRQKNASMQELVTRARKGDIRGAVALLGNRLQEHEKDELAREVADKWHGHTDRERIQIAALDNASRIRLNMYIRRHLQDEGKVDAQDYDFHILSSKGLTNAQLAISDYYKKDDVLVFHSAQKFLGIKKDSRFTVKGAREGQVTLTDLQSGESISIEPAKISRTGLTLYEEQARKLALGDRIQWRKNMNKVVGVQNGHTGTILGLDGKHARIAFDHGKIAIIDLHKHPYWDHGYALTAYKQQGKTTPVNWLVVNTSRPGNVTGKSFYVSLTRAERSVMIFTDDREKFIRQIENNPGDKTSSLEGRGITVDLKEKARKQQMSLTGRIIDRLPDHLRSIGTNLLERYNDRYRREQSQGTTSIRQQLDALKASTHYTVKSADKVAGQSHDLGRDR